MPQPASSQLFERLMFRLTVCLVNDTASIQGDKELMDENTLLPLCWLSRPQSMTRTVNGSAGIKREV
jgi:hypothetical protein